MRAFCAFVSFELLAVVVVSTGSVVVASDILFKLLAQFHFVFLCKFNISSSYTLPVTVVLFDAHTSYR